MDFIFRSSLESIRVVSLASISLFGLIILFSPNCFKKDWHHCLTCVQKKNLKRKRRRSEEWQQEQHLNCMQVMKFTGVRCYQNVHTSQLMREVFVYFIIKAASSGCADQLIQNWVMWPGVSRKALHCFLCISWSLQCVFCFKARKHMIIIWFAFYGKQLSKIFRFAYRKWET